MAVTTLLSLGYMQTMLQNVVYALPSRRVLIYAEGTPTLLQSADGSNFTAVTINTTTNNQAELAGAFVKVTSTDCDVLLKAMS